MSLYGLRSTISNLSISNLYLRKNEENGRKATFCSPGQRFEVGYHGSYFEEKKPYSGLCSQEIC